MNYGFEIKDLTGAEVVEELSPLHFDDACYTSFEELLTCISQLPECPRRVYNYQLSINGRVSNDSMDRYLAAPANSSSLLKQALNSPRHYYIAAHQPMKPKNASHFELGTFVHSAILEPDKFAKVRVLPAANRATIDGLCELIEFYRQTIGAADEYDISTMKMQALRTVLRDLELRAADMGYTFIDADDRAVVDVIRSAYMTYGDGILPRLMRYAKTETSMYGRDAVTRMKVKIRPDGMILSENLGMNLIVSVKTTSATSIEAFLRDCAKYRYELAEGMYLDVASQITGRPFSGTLMIMAQTVIPYQVAVLYWDAEDLEIGKYKYRQALDIVKQCTVADSWPGFESKAESGAYGIIQAKLPDYIKSELLPQYLPE